MTNGQKYTPQEFYDAGWLPPSELKPIAKWQRDARKAFADIEDIATSMLISSSCSPEKFGIAALGILDALGDRFRKPVHEDNDEGNSQN